MKTWTLLSVMLLAAWCSAQQPVQTKDYLLPSVPGEIEYWVDDSHGVLCGVALNLHPDHPWTAHVFDSKTKPREFSTVDDAVAWLNSWCQKPSPQAKPAFDVAGCDPSGKCGSVGTSKPDDPADPREDCYTQGICDFLGEGKVCDSHGKCEFPQQTKLTDDPRYYGPIDSGALKVVPENGWVYNLLPWAYVECRGFVRKDGYAHSLIDGREYVQTCHKGKLGILRPYVKPARRDTALWACTKATRGDRMIFGGDCYRTLTCEADPSDAKKSKWIVDEHHKKEN